ncbi:hypothetical protein GQ457_16G014970 [Hibiscus cannabinus]
MGPIPPPRTLGPCPTQHWQRASQWFTGFNPRQVRAQPEDRRVRLALRRNYAVPSRNPRRSVVNNSTTTGHVALSGQDYYAHFKSQEDEGKHHGELSSHPSIYGPERNYDGMRCVSAYTTTTFCSIEKSMTTPEGAQPRMDPTKRETTTGRHKPWAYSGITPSPNVSLNPDSNGVQDHTSTDLHDQVRHSS